jgi:hypothetical protein
MIKTSLDNCARSGSQTVPYSIVAMISKELLNQVVGNSWVFTLDSPTLTSGKLVAHCQRKRPGNVRQLPVVNQRPSLCEPALGSGVFGSWTTLHRPLSLALERSLIVFRKQNIAVGRSYVNEDAHIAREVVEEIDRRKVKYNAFDLVDGRLIPAAMQTCRKSDLAHWADREANPAEIARIHPYDPQPWFEGVPQSEVKAAGLELTKANIQQAVGNNTVHRW